MHTHVPTYISIYIHTSIHPYVNTYTGSAGFGNKIGYNHDFNVGHAFVFLINNSVNNSRHN